MIDFYFYPSPNGLKVSIMLCEAELPFTLKPVDITRGEQFKPEFLKISPNSKIPAIVDHHARGGPLSLFESGAILLHLAERTERFIPDEYNARMRCLQWLFWQVGGLGPMAGQAHHFRAFAPEKIPYGIKRYTDECNRLYGVMDRQLATSEYIAGEYSIADMACWPWIVFHERQGQSLEDFPNLKRWFETVGARKAVKAGFAMGHEKHADLEGYKYLYGQTSKIP